VIAKLKPGGAQLWVTGMIGKDELTQELNARLPAWRARPRRAEDRRRQAAPRHGVLRAREGRRAVVDLRRPPGPARDRTPDYEATDLMMEILGGSFSSRINMNLREAKGYTYGGRAGIGYRRTGSSFAASSSVRTDVTGPALREVHQGDRRDAHGDPTAEELKRVQEGALLALPAEFATPSDTLFVFQRLEFYGLPLDWYAGYQGRLKAVDTSPRCTRPRRSTCAARTSWCWWSATRTRSCPTSTRSPRRSCSARAAWSCSTPTASRRRARDGPTDACPQGQVSDQAHRGPAGPRATL
jgi:zinc protease